MTRVAVLLAGAALLAFVAACDAVDRTVPPTPTSIATHSPAPSAVPTDTWAPTDPTEQPLPEAAWRRQSTTDDLPEARSGHTWTVDPSDSAAYLVGGRDARETFGDIWLYDLGADRWIPLRPEGRTPPPRSGHAAVWSDDVGLVVFGGIASDGSPRNDVWVFDPARSRWRELIVEGGRPSPRSASCASIGPDDRVWISHGFGAGGDPVDDTWALDVGTGRWAEMSPAVGRPDRRGAHGCWWTADDRLVLYGGRRGSTTSAEIWVLVDAGEPGAAWSRIVDAGSAGARSDFAWTRYNDRIVIVGGRDATGAVVGDVVTFDVVTLHVERFLATGEAPDGRAAAALAEDPADERLLLFGGDVRGRTSDEFWRLVLR